MRTKRMTEIPGFGIDRVAAAVGEDPDVLRLENLDTDLAPPEAALRATREAVGQDDANSWLPFTGKVELRRAVADQFEERSGVSVDPDTQVVITCGDGDAMVDALFVTTDPGDEVILVDPTYAGMINRVRIVGAIPRLVPLRPEEGEWRLDTDALAGAVTDHTRAIFVANPGMPTGNHLSDEEWEAIASICRERDVWLIYLAWMERILFDGRPYRHPASLPDMADRVVHVGCVTMEQRMIGWRIGWVVSPAELADDAARAHIYNGLTPGGIAQAGSVAALQAPPEDLTAAVAEWERRRNTTLEQLEGLPAVRSAGGWSLLMDVEAMGLTPPDLSKALVDQKVAATPMTTWGERVSPRFIRFVYSNEPVERLSQLGERLRRAVDQIS
ncbi:MAG TPA: pyridoxal phosphate-dependent aminotransferase [Actinomycetota bacterium]|nr:pyridoxal phosphate-dependent aminotransferase [Actinomycetota bacterium]